jgi:hypothetical protein
MAKQYSISGNQFKNFNSSFRDEVIDCYLINYSFDRTTNTVHFSSKENLKLFITHFNSLLDIIQKEMECFDKRYHEEIQAEIDFDRNVLRSLK